MAEITLKSKKRTDPFNKMILKKILRFDSKIQNRIINRESKTIEFKKSFHSQNILSDYSRTLAAFSNTNGGYLIFGISDKPRTLVGLVNDNFEYFDPAIFTSSLNSRFSPEIIWESHIHTIKTKKIGIIYVNESQQKPVIAIANDHKIKEGQIYYRYGGRTQTIKYSELRQIIDDIKDKVTELMLKHLTTIKNIGIDKVATFNLEDGIVSGKTGTFIIDSKLLPDLKFINEGDFSSKSGTPAVRLVGNAQIIAGNINVKSTVKEIVIIHEDDIIVGFLKQLKMNEPMKYLEEICYQDAGYIPIYYYAKLANINFKELKKLVRKSKSSRQGKNILLRRFSNKDIHVFQQIPITETAFAL